MYQKALCQEVRDLPAQQHLMPYCRSHAELLAQVTEVLKPYGLTPEEAAVQFFEYCVDSKTQDHAIKLLKRWKEEQEAQERNSANAK